MAAVWADLAPAFAFSTTTLDTDFTGFEPAKDPITGAETEDPQIALIRSALLKLYNGSPTAQALIDVGASLTPDATSISRFTKQITIYKCPDPRNSAALRGQNIVSLNADIVNNLTWIGVDGRLHEEPRRTASASETGRAEPFRL